MQRLGIGTAETLREWARRAVVDYQAGPVGHRRTSRGRNRAVNRLRGGAARTAP
jgi:hypothetical protein